MACCKTNLYFCKAPILLISNLPRYPSFVFLTFEDVCDSITSMVVAVRVAGVAHLIVFFLVFKEMFERIVDCFFIRSNKFERSCISTFGSFTGMKICPSTRPFDGGYGGGAFYGERIFPGLLGCFSYHFVFFCENACFGLFR